MPSMRHCKARRPGTRPLQKLFVPDMIQGYIASVGLPLPELVYGVTVVIEIGVADQALAPAPDLVRIGHDYARQRRPGDFLDGRNVASPRHQALAASADRAASRCAARPRCP